MSRTRKSHVLCTIRSPRPGRKEKALGVRRSCIARSIEPLNQALQKGSPHLCLDPVGPRRAEPARMLQRHRVRPQPVPVGRLAFGLRGLLRRGVRVAVRPRRGLVREARGRRGVRRAGGGSVGRAHGGVQASRLRVWRAGLGWGRVGRPCRHVRRRSGRGVVRLLRRRGVRSPRGRIRRGVHVCRGRERGGRVARLRGVGRLLGVGVRVGIGRPSGAGGRLLGEVRRVGIGGGGSRGVGCNRWRRGGCGRGGRLGRGGRCLLRPGVGLEVRQGKALQRQVRRCACCKFLACGLCQRAVPREPRHRPRPPMWRRRTLPPLHRLPLRTGRRPGSRPRISCFLRRRRLGRSPLPFLPSTSSSSFPISLPSPLQTRGPLLLRQALFDAGSSPPTGRLAAVAVHRGQRSRGMTGPGRRWLGV
ncbi:hypothetical protein DFJ74DRAFT_336379 [Hyaloraphidium curvatum]|nr:hypothetical protein DFJ74DRAFT_336379 [Hyaloraphidium curvatum]